MRASNDCAMQPACCECTRGPAQAGEPPKSGTSAVFVEAQGKPDQAPAFIPERLLSFFSFSSAAFFAAASCLAFSGLVMRWTASMTFVPLSICSRGSFRSLQASLVKAHRSQSHQASHSLCWKGACLCRSPRRPNRSHGYLHLVFPFVPFPGLSEDKQPCPPPT